MHNTKLYVHEGWKYNLASGEDIKDVHGKCGTCSYILICACDADLSPVDFMCTFHDREIYDPGTEYCNEYKLNLAKK